MSSKANVTRCAPAPAPRLLLLALLPIGDTLFTTPTIRALRVRYPSARITALAHAATAPLLKRAPALDDVVTLPFRDDWAGLGPLARSLRRLQARHYDAAVDFTTPAYKWIAFACAVPLRTYMKFDPLWWLIPADHARWRATHATQHYYACARELDLPPWEQVSHAPSLQLRSPEREDAARFLRDHELTRSGGPLVAMHVGAAGLGGLKQWPPERFAALADRLSHEWNARVVLLGGRAEAALAKAVAASARTRPTVAAGATTLLTSIALAAASDLFIGNDSGPLHAAVAVGAPYVGIFGPTALSNFRPLPRRAGQGLVVTPPFPCHAPRYFVGGDIVWRRPCPYCRERCRALEAIAVDRVYTAAAAVLRDQRGAVDGRDAVPAAGFVVNRR